MWDLINPATWVKVAADATGLALKSTGQLAGNVVGMIGGETVKQNVINGFNQAGEAVRNNDVTRGVDQLNEMIGLRQRKHPVATELIRWIDGGQDIAHPSITREQFVERIGGMDTLMYYCLIASLSYSTDVSREGIQKDYPYIEEDHLRRFEDQYDVLKRTDKYLLLTRRDNPSELCISFKGTTDGQDLLHDLSVGNLVGGYHEKMLELCVEYVYEDDGYMWKQIEQASKVLTSSHSLGAGISVYLVLLLDMKGMGHKVHSYLYSCPVVLPRCIQKRTSVYFTSVINNSDPIPKYYKNTQVCHPCEMVHINRNDEIAYGRFEIDFSRFIPNVGIQVDKIRKDVEGVEYHKLESLYTLLGKNRV